MGLWHIKFQQPSMFKMEEQINHPWEKEDNGRSNNGADTQVEVAPTTDDVFCHGDDLPNNNMDDELA